MIDSLEIQNLRGIREGKLDKLTSLVVLVGPNGSGKSTVLDALLIGTSKYPNEAVQEAIKRHPGVDQGARWLVWFGAMSEPIRISVSTDTGGSRTLKLGINPVGLAPNNIKCLQESSSPQGTEGSGPQIPATDGVSEARLLEPRAFDAVPPLHRSYTEAVVQGRRDEVRNIVTDLIPHATNLEILTDADRPIVHVVFDDHSVPVAFAGDGIYSLIRLSLELASRPSGVILVEEPEVHQHPAAIRGSVLAILAAIRRGIQVIITTHSLELIDSLLAEASQDDLEKLCVYRLSLDQGMLKSRRISGTEAAFLRTEIKDDLR